ncbi:dTDP-glucose 4,6-dehydratase [Actinoplanes teichomyceticus]|uniref:dTDP-glucose 4,6-dehydratase n=1 Tax=Actinoplanes teichomyceticus TaxID=1867 RepID=A0A561WBW0_ACTTI|nr:dTDP-glucose 4,6-dehydratase [Actinoplanes teichomyceticus]TWG21352.1 dTDP-glucose 4,6-dehydratase [Actinoplanes teichomyceticus]GIF16437.1 dTDP-glucose 4,6-dehydratase [Actinoplanes teichomyceticus]
MRILVTGGAGFIGSHFVRATLRGQLPGSAGSQVTVLDKLTYSGNLANLAPVAGVDGYRFVHGDTCDPEVVDRAVAGQDVVVHFAAETHVDRSLVAADQFVRTNVLGTQTLLEAALRHRVRRFVHVSTDEVYGSIEHGSWTEQTPLSPNVPYAAAKAGSDVLALAYHRSFGLDVCVTRCTNNYGPYQFPEKVIPLFVTNLLDARRVPLYGDGRNRRDWLHVADHCRGIQLVLQDGRAGEVYHIGGGTELSNIELTGRLLEACGAGWDAVDRVPDRQGHDRRYSLDTTKITRELGYRPQIDFTEGLAATVAWYRENRAWWEPLRERATARQRRPEPTFH